MQIKSRNMVLTAAPIEGTNPSFILPDQTCQRLTLAQIELATNNFDEALVIGRGGFGKVFKSLTKFGSVDDEVAIKRLHSTSSQGAHEFEAEVKLLSKLRHGNLVPLIGYCSEGKEMILAYEFMPNGTLEDHLHKGDLELSWLQLLKICIGTARGLDYLHMGTSTQHGVIHRDVKTSNILLDSNFAAKISDFGLAKVSTINQTRTHVSTLVKGTFGYMDPCYFYTGKLTRKSDVYAFGVVLFVVLSGKQAVDRTLEDSLAVWAQEHFKQGKLNEIVNHRLMGQISKKCLKGFARIAAQCLHNQPKQRPTMAEVVVKLESILSQERESSSSSIHDGRLFNKVRYFFTSKADLIQAHAEGNTFKLMPAQAEESRSEVSAISSNFNDEESFIYFDESIYRVRVDELTYAPKESGGCLDVKRHIETSELNLKPEEFYHPNLVKLLGYYLNEQELSSVYTSLDKLLFGEPGITSLSWVARLKIAIGAAQRLSFLHKRGHPAFTQFKTACILVDADYNVRLRDSEVDDSSVAPGSYSSGKDTRYAVPKWFPYQADVIVEEGTNNVEKRFAACFGVKSEIYSFGVVLLEILTGMKVVDFWNIPTGKQSLVTWAILLLTLEEEKEEEEEAHTYYNDNDGPPNSTYKLALLVSDCLQLTQDERPSMEEILQVLCECNPKQFDS